LQSLDDFHSFQMIRPISLEPMEIPTRRGLLSSRDTTAMLKHGGLCESYTAAFSPETAPASPSMSVLTSSENADDDSSLVDHGSGAATSEARGLFQEPNRSLPRTTIIPPQDNIRGSYLEQAVAAQLQGASVGAISFGQLRRRHQFATEIPFVPQSESLNLRVAPQFQVEPAVLSKPAPPRRQHDLYAGPYHPRPRSLAAPQLMRNATKSTLNFGSPTPGDGGVLDSFSADQIGSDPAVHGARNFAFPNGRRGVFQAEQFSLELTHDTSQPPQAAHGPQRKMRIAEGHDGEIQIVTMPTKPVGEFCRPPCASAGPGECWLHNAAAPAFHATAATKLENGFDGFMDLEAATQTLESCNVEDIPPAHQVPVSPMITPPPKFVDVSRAASGCFSIKVEPRCDSTSHVGGDSFRGDDSEQSQPDFPHPDRSGFGGWSFFRPISQLPNSLTRDPHTAANCPAFYQEQDLPAAAGVIHPHHAPATDSHHCWGSPHSPFSPASQHSLDYQQAPDAAANAAGCTAAAAECTAAETFFLGECVDYTALLLTDPLIDALADPFTTLDFLPPPGNTSTGDMSTGNLPAGAQEPALVQDETPPSSLPSHQRGDADVEEDLMQASRALATGELLRGTFGTEVPGNSPGYQSGVQSGIQSGYNSEGLSGDQSGDPSDGASGDQSVDPSVNGGVAFLTMMGAPGAEAQEEEEQTLAVGGEGVGLEKGVGVGATVVAHEQDGGVQQKRKQAQKREGDETVADQPKQARKRKGSSSTKTSRQGNNDAHLSAVVSTSPEPASALLDQVGGSSEGMNGPLPALSPTAASASPKGPGPKVKVRRKAEQASGGEVKYIGVRKRGSGNRWVAEIKDNIHGVRRWLGTFSTPEEAAREYDKAAREIRGENTRRTNFPIIA
ncbi:hypothetical protein CLOM_g4338, partial [Closterium sp. NIES-68]